MTRYFEKFYNIDPMVEISADDARARGIYTVEDDVPMRRYRRFIDHELHTIVYAGWADPTKALADFRLLASGVPGQIFSPTTRMPHGGHSWICWYVQAALDGSPAHPIRVAMANRVRPEFQSTVGRLTNAIFPVLHCAPEWTFSELLQHAGSTLRTAYDHQEAPFEVVARELGAASAPIDGGFSITLFDDPIERLWLAGLRTEAIDLAGSLDSKRDLTLYLMQRKDGIEASLVYRRSRLDEATVVRLFEHWSAVLALACRAPYTRVDTILHEVLR